jgi:hypothetical protein
MNWTDINHYTNGVGTPLPAGTIGTADTDLVLDGSGAHEFTVRNPVSGSASMQVIIDEQFPGYDLRTEEVTFGNLKSHSDSHFPKMFPENAFSRHIFDYYKKDQTVRWAKWSGTNKVDFTGVAWDDTQIKVGVSTSTAEITMISPWHGLMAQHTVTRRGLYLSGYPAGTDPIPPTVSRNTVHFPNDPTDPKTVVAFHDRQGNRIERRIEKYVNLLGCDLSVIKLDQPVPESVKKYKSLPHLYSDGTPINWNDHLQNQQVLLTLRERECVWYQIESVATNGCDLKYQPLGTVPMGYRLPPPYEQFRGGDSGGPSFVFVNGEPVLIGLNGSKTTGMDIGPGRGSFIPSGINTTRINSTMDLLHPGYFLQQVNIRP